jgi:protein TonB
MFGALVERQKMGSKQGASVMLTFVLEAVILGAVVIIPLMAADVLPTPPSMLAFVAAPPPVEVVNPNAAPVEAPKEIKPEVPVDTSFERNVGVEGGIPGGVVGGVVGGLPEAPPPPPPPPPAQPVRVGGQIKAPTQVRKVNPTYPSIAQSARVQGVVILEATIGIDGKVKDVKVLRSIPLLDQAAIDAVRQWEYTPTLLNNVPVPVIMTVTVQFTLN